ncbi:MAG TPA: carotenoid oxygenase family protein [Acidimicrobiales bacterium]|nr:carotenoid oxygenase family protein [Acidimicrobiales bacterium]
MALAEDTELDLANPYLAGLYAAVDDELTAGDLEVIGEIPADLDGIFVRNGPNPRFDPVGRYHWFDGDGMLHAVRFEDGRATYRNRFIATAALARDRDAGRPLWRGVIEPVAANPADMPLKDTANTDVVWHRGSLLATWYLSGQPYALDPVSLDTLGPSDFGGTLPCRMSAHAKVDESSGELFFFDYGPVRPWLRYGVVGADGQVAHLVDIDLPGPRLPHDMAITARHAVVMDLPLVNDREAARVGRHKIVFDPELPARFGVIPRYGAGAEVRWFEAEPCYIYHVVNSWEEGDEIVLDVCRVTKPEPAAGVGPLARMLSYLRLDAQLHRYRFDLARGTTSEQPLDDDNTEFPSVPSALVGRPTRFSYNVHISPEPTLLFDGIVKYDTALGTSQRYLFGPGRWGSESPFAARRGGTDEDDGYLVSFVHDAGTDRSEVVILSAADPVAGPIGRVLLPQRVPIGFHACWVKGEWLADNPG